MVPDIRLEIEHEPLYPEITHVLPEGEAVTVIEADPAPLIPDVALIEAELLEAVTDVMVGAAAASPRTLVTIVTDAEL